MAALDEVLVGLRVVEAAHDGPDGGHGGGDLLDHGGAALVGAHLVSMVHGHRVGDLGGAWQRVAALTLFDCGGIRVDSL